MTDYQIASHRGGNSLESLALSIEKGFHYAELDAHMTRDQIVIVQHSPKVNINGNDIYIQDIQYASLTEEEKEKLLLLTDVLRYSRGKIGIVIDIKRGRDFYSGIGRRIAEIVKELGAIDAVWMISFDHSCLVEAKHYVPDIKTAVMYVARLHQDETYWKATAVDGIEICTDYMSSDIAQKAHDNHLTLVGWCARNREELQALLSFGTDIITIELNDTQGMDFLKMQKEA